MTRHVWTHDGLAADVMDARHRAGEVAIERLSVCGGQLDVAGMRLSWTNPKPTAYEVKVSRPDFLKDVGSGKWQHYLGAVQRVYFCVPKGLVAPDEVPPDCGVMYRGRRGWFSARRPREQALDPERFRKFIQAILFRHYPAVWDGPARTRRSVLAQAAQPICPLRP